MAEVGPNLLKRRYVFLILMVLLDSMERFLHNIETKPCQNRGSEKTL